MWNNIFEEIKHINEFWNEYWSAREFAKVLWYKDFWNFENVISKAKKAGAKLYGIFTNYWYMWLYNWLDASWIHKKKWLKKSEKILDHMWSEELAANLFRKTQAEAKLKKEWIYWASKANKAHFEVWKEVRETIKKLWGTMPEELPANDSIKKVGKRLGVENKKLDN